MWFESGLFCCEENHTSQCSPLLVSEFYTISIEKNTGSISGQSLEPVAGLQV